MGMQAHEREGVRERGTDVKQWFLGFAINAISQWGLWVYKNCLIGALRVVIRIGVIQVLDQWLSGVGLLCATEKLVPQRRGETTEVFGPVSATQRFQVNCRDAPRPVE